MDYISETEHKELIDILDELIKTISLLRNSNSDYILVQNENEISDRFFYKYDVEIENSELDNKRAYLIRKYIFTSNKLLKR